MPRMPRWQPPTDIAQALADGDGMWEDERWSPILVTATSATEYDGRAIPVAWQIEFDPSADEFEAANSRLAERDIVPDGYGWGLHVQSAIRKGNPALAERLHLGDCETATCVLWVESAEDCRALLEVVWALVFAA